MKALILAGGQGLRMRPLTEDRPKPLVPVNGRPIAELQIEWLKNSADIDKIIFLCGYRWEKLQEHFGDNFQGTEVSYSVEETPLGTGGAIRKAVLSANLSENIIVMNGDVLTDLPMKNMIHAHGAPAIQSTVTMLLVPFKSRFGVVHIDKLKIVRKFEEKPEFPDVWINGGIYIIDTKKIAKHLPEQGDVERATFPKLVEYGEISAFPYYGFWSFMDSVKDLKDTEDHLKVARAP